MASKRPLVHYSGTLKELVDNDTLDVRGFLDVVAAATTARIYSTGGDSTLRVMRPAGYTGRLDFGTGASTRWSLQVDNSAESGSNAGSSLVLYRYSDAGSGSTAFSIDRATGAISLFGSVSTNGNISATSGTVSAINASFTGTISVSSTATFGGNVTGPAYFWNGATNGFQPQSGTYNTTGSYRVNTVWNATPGQGDNSYAGAYHQPGVDSFFQLNQGGGGAYFRFRNDGWGASNNGWTTHSDARLKFDIADIEEVQARVMALPVKTFRKYSETVGMAGPKLAPLRVGVIAQDAVVALPEAVHDAIDLELNEYRLSVDYGMVGALALAGVQDLYTRLDAALSRIQELERALNPSGTA